MALLLLRAVVRENDSPREEPCAAARDNAANIPRNAVLLPCRETRKEDGNHRVTESTEIAQRKTEKKTKERNRSRTPRRWRTQRKTRHKGSRRSDNRRSGAPAAVCCRSRYPRLRDV